jgi:hypothetical protein
MKAALTFTCRWCGRPAPELAAILAHQRDDAACAEKTTPEAYQRERAAATERAVLIALGKALRPEAP